MSAAITIARAVKPRVPLAKTIVVEDGEIVRAGPAPKAFLYEFEEVPVHALESLAEVIQSAAQEHAIVVRAKPKARSGRRAVYDDPKKGPAGLEVVPRPWVGFDWDGLPIEPEGVPSELANDPAEWCNWASLDPLLAPERGAKIALRRLPPPFRDVSCLWQVSASAGFKLGFRLRTWHWLDYPLTGAELKTWLLPAITRGLLDPVTLVEAQPHYLGVRVIGGPDPCPRRFGLLRLAREAVPVPDIQGIQRRQKERAQAEREKAAAERRKMALPQINDASATPDSKARYAQARIDECLTAIRKATARHTTYKSEAARAYAICERHGLDWALVRAQLRDTYLSTLTAAEARERESYSTEGVLRWIERRAAA